MTPLEITANLITTVSILLAARNSIHTWWTAIVGGALFAVLFYQNRLYADVTLQLFFIVTSLAGWLRRPGSWSSTTTGWPSGGDRDWPIRSRQCPTTTSPKTFTAASPPGWPATSSG
ncbi:MAG TPA: nicotinamide mononucleotide transporter family protein [Novosphingobium sp.]